jgi:predicted Zn-dependent protease
VVFLGVRTFRRQGDWQDQRTFIERTIAAGGNSPRMLMNLANVEFAEGHPDTALNLYREALRRAPDQSIIWLGYASVLLRTHQYPAARDALGHAEKSPFLAPDIDLLRAGLENADTGRDPGDLLRQAVTLAPKNWDIRKRYIDYLHDSGKPQDAIRELQQFLKQADFRAESWRLFGALLEEQHQPGLAIEAYREAALRDVRDADSRAKIAAAR